MAESVSPDQVEKTTFSTALRGYDRDEVDIFLRRVAAELREVEKLRSEKIYESLGEEIGNLLQHAKDSAAAMIKEAEEDSARIRADAEAAAREMRATAERDATQMRTAAENDAEATRSQADRDAEQRINAAEAKVMELQDAEETLREKLAMLRADLEVVVAQLRRLEQPVDEIRLDDTQQAITLEPQPQPEPETAG